MRRLSIRERVLLVILAVLVVICGYVFLFYLPSDEMLTALDGRIQQSQAILDQSQVMLAHQRQMERALEELQQFFSWITTKLSPLLLGIQLKNCCRASSPPADAPIPMIRGIFPPPERRRGEFSRFS